MTPVFIPSKSRATTQLTSGSLSALGIPHTIIVEASQLAEYEANRTSHARYVVLDPEYQRRFSRLLPDDVAPGYGAGPARNMAWDLAVAAGARWHWVMDDNIRGFWRMNHNRKIPIEGKAGARALEAMEDFAARYENVVMAGPHYYMFGSRKSRNPPFAFNSRVYSCNLIRTDIPFRWEGRYNDDTDLSLRILRAGYATVLYRTFLAWKMTTMTMKGGYAEDYVRDGRLLATKVLVERHPEFARLTRKWDRWHHHVDYRPFSDPASPWYVRPRLRPGYQPPQEADEYGMAYLENDGTGWQPAVPRVKAAPGA